MSNINKLSFTLKKQLSKRSTLDKQIMDTIEKLTAEAKAAAKTPAKAKKPAAKKTPSKKRAVKKSTTKKAPVKKTRKKKKN